MKNLAYAIEWKLTELGLFKGANIQTKEDVLVFWEVSGLKQPSEVTLQAWCEEYASKGLPEYNFKTDLMLGAMGYAFTGVDAVNLAPYLSAIQNYADFKNFKGIKDFITGLVALNKATPDQATALYGIFSQQQIDLGSY